MTGDTVGFEPRQSRKTEVATEDKLRRLVAAYEEQRRTLAQLHDELEAEARAAVSAGASAEVVASLLPWSPPGFGALKGGSGLTLVADSRPTSAPSVRTGSQHPKRVSAPSRLTETRHHPKGKTCHHFAFHGMTCDEYDRLRERAAGHCELCGTPEALTGGKRLVVEHFSGPGIRFIRGLVCDKCNVVMSCLDGDKPWGANRVWEAKARQFEATSWQRPTLSQLETVARLREQRRVAQERERARRDALSAARRAA